MSYLSCCFHPGISHPNTWGVSSWSCFPEKMKAFFQQRGTHSYTKHPTFKDSKYSFYTNVDLRCSSPKIHENPTSCFCHLQNRVAPGSRGPHPHACCLAMLPSQPTQASVNGHLRPWPGCSLDNMIAVWMPIWTQLWSNMIWYDLYVVWSIESIVWSIVWSHIRKTTCIA